MPKYLYVCTFVLLLSNSAHMTEKFVKLIFLLNCNEDHPSLRIYVCIYIYMHFLHRPHSLADLALNNYLEMIKIEKQNS